MPKTRKPTPKQLRFCHEYMVDLNASAAYVRAGYSENGAAQAAYKLLRNAYILEAIEGLQAAKTRRMEVTEEQLLKNLGEIAFSKPAGPPSVQDQHNALVALMRHKGMFPNGKRGRGTGVRGPDRVPAGGECPDANVGAKTSSSIPARSTRRGASQG